MAQQTQPAGNVLEETDGNLLHWIVARPRLKRREPEQSGMQCAQIVARVRVEGEAGLTTTHPGGRCGGGAPNLRAWCSRLSAKGTNAIGGEKAGKVQEDKEMDAEEIGDRLGDYLDGVNERVEAVGQHLHRERRTGVRGGVCVAVFPVA